MRLIDADAYKAKMKEKQDECVKWRDEAKARQIDDVYYMANGELSSFIEAKLTLDKMPTIDAVEVVRCKDCRYGYCEKQFYFADSYRCNIHDDGFETHNADWYCPDGKRKDEE